MTLREVLIRRGIQVMASSSDPAEIRICCPFCVDNGETQDERFRLGINVVSGAAHCFNCSWKSRNCKRYILRKLSIPDTADDNEPSEAYAPPEKIELPFDFQRLTRSYTDLDRMAARYLKKRGISLDQIRRNRIGVSFVGRYAYRIIFPVLDGKELQGLVCRDFTGQQEPKYLNSKGIKSLYNLYPAKYLILSEGVFKCLRIEQAISSTHKPGEYCSSAILGRSLTEEQISQIRKTGFEEVALWPDPDRPGKQGAIDIAETLKEACFKVSIIWPVEVPADEASFDLLAKMWKENLKPYGFAIRQKLRVRTS